MSEKNKNKREVNKEVESCPMWRGVSRRCRSFNLLSDERIYRLVPGASLIDFEDNISH